jgi:SAM-dependent methyltransferase
LEIEPCTQPLERGAGGVELGVGVLAVALPLQRLRQQQPRPRGLVGGTGLPPQRDAAPERHGRRACRVGVAVGERDLHLGGQQPRPRQAVLGLLRQGDRDRGGGLAHVAAGEPDQRHARLRRRPELRGPGERLLGADEGLSGSITYQVGDAHHLPYGDGGFDIVTLHTLISHVDDPLQVLREARRLVRPGGTVAVFDGDYASLTFGYPDHALARTIEEKLIQLIVANPRIMRDLPRLLREAGLELADAEGTLYADVGGSRFWVAATESYGVLLGRSGLLPQELVDDWRAFQAHAAADNTFFGASSYYTYLTRRPG